MNNKTDSGLLLFYKDSYGTIKSYYHATNVPVALGDIQLPKEVLLGFLSAKIATVDADCKIHVSDEDCDIKSLIESELTRRCIVCDFCGCKIKGNDPDLRECIIVSSEHGEYFDSYRTCSIKCFISVSHERTAHILWDKCARVSIRAAFFEEILGYIEGLRPLEGAK